MPIADFLTERVSVMRQSLTKDAAGGPVNEYAVLIADIPARVEHRTLSIGPPDMITGAPTQVFGYRVFIEPLSQALENGDVLRLDSPKRTRPGPVQPMVKISENAERMQCGSMGEFWVLGCRELNA